MSTRAHLRVSCLSLLAGGLLACTQKPAAPGAKPDSGAAATATTAAKPVLPSPEKLAEQAKGLFGVLPLAEAVAAKDDPALEAKVELGRMLYFDPRLSKSQEIACNTCHDLTKFGVDGRMKDGKRTATSEGHKGAFGGRNSPTVYNAVLHIAQFWDGRAPDLVEQAKGPVLNPVEMAMPADAQVLKVLKSIPGYAAKFKAAFPKDKAPITYQNMALAIAAFEARLLTPAPIDDFMTGRLDALTKEQQAGLARFIDAGCIACHNGPAFGGRMYQKLGLVKPFDTKDLGRFDLTKNDADKFFFKVPSLRNIAMTAPYLHDGSVETLEEMVQLMATHQTGTGKLSDADVSSIVAFLGSLTGRLPEEEIKAPELPKSGPKTPKPSKG